MAVADILGRWGSAAVAPVSSFPELLKANQSMVYSIALHFLRDRDTAEEIAQDVFLELHRHYHEMESDSHASFWLRKVAGRRSIDALRKRKYRSALALEQVPEPAARESLADPMLRRKVESLIAALPAKPRMIMILRYQEDMMPEEISKILDMPVGSVKSHLTRALAALREKLKRMNGEAANG